ncbi:MULTISPECIES: Dps family protein [unclassified Paenibacillus]|uniref:Dps family protein n=1 Tax=unclassified Paenibacillus TaxID=185978 RepID=UPI001C1207CC|nr:MULTISPECIES: Dps family protein [unclassified Paenibacillus]MBU5440781.1 DNA starvation/stationary phase protection protein [Paenibacillus sp. MSJ-34]CAH0119174.1 DNA protection during starvation protein 2 [Paenibacillus sp. CECT 9249]
MKPVVDVLNKQLANWNVLFVKLHNFHWYVKGEQFFTLHAKFEELYGEAAQYVDDLAERVLAVQGTPLATMKDYLATATVAEAKGGETAQQMVQAIADDFTKLIGELQAGMEIAQANNDESTSDMLLGIHTSLEKHVWMLRSFLA